MQKVHACKSWEGYTRSSFGSLFTPAYNKTASIHLAVESFRVTWIFPFNRNIFPVNVFSPAATISRSLPENVSESLVVDGNEENLKHRPTAELTEEEPLDDKVNIDSMESSPTVQPDIQSTADDGPITDSGELTAADDDCSRVDLCTSILQYMTGVACYLLNLVNMKLLNIYHVRA